ncbi:hypothetical protein CLV44_13412 [Marinobacterium halophilum]|uniref:Uncharacterized protein n=1 Tax=Marinobacterium halophilum TaxID=267374 RepID=A0A2P8EIB4_9GAMM|nr:hypothetical protein [Marinobacterium halophilum]PSL09199.1 hypothetical protein CLV44_13412 [Marinobacterium halophilum]
MSRFTIEDVEAVKRLLTHAKRKTFIRDFLLNAYNPWFSCDIRTLMCYSDGFGGDMTFQQDVYRVLALMVNGVETNELVGDEIMEALARERRAEDKERAG